MRLPDTKFLNLPNDYGACLVEVTYSGMSGAREYFLVHNTQELEALVNRMPPQSRISIVEAMSCTWQDEVITADANGKLKQGSY
jgi:hypothetical protein